MSGALAHLSKRPGVKGTTKPFVKGLLRSRFAPIVGLGMVVVSAFDQLGEFFCNVKKRKGFVGDVVASAAESAKELGGFISRSGWEVANSAVGA